ncbi:LacI family DNA-binding transcriptional regulator [Litorimonas sp. RW-G-Af-16]|uniref:LacI family DNA-binding transcriptional regulator n=1 Tax=Litorimonas sp. RW-G-Af-16 TaxID=3241168 RepID=UPI00390C606F
MKATITDVAQKAGVSMKTVSRVLNKEPNVAEKTRERVMAVASELRYSPNLAARGLASSKSYLIALIYDNPNAYYITELQRGAISACRKRGYHVVLEPTKIRELSSPEEVKSASEMIFERLHVDGVILAPPLSDSQELIDVVRARNLPYVLVAPSETSPDVPSVKMDDFAAAYELTQNLIAQGHQRIGFIKGHYQHSSADLRLEGFCHAIKEAGLSKEPGLIKDGDYSFRSGVVAAEALLEADNPPTAIFACNDDMAAGVIHVAARLGLSVPDGLSVCGFDDTPLATIMWPQLTTVAQPIYEMGYGAADMLLRQDTETGDDHVQTFDFTIKKRGSTARA